MNEAMNAAETIEKFARQYAPMVKAAEILKRIGSLEQAEQEANVRTAEARREADAVSAKVQEAAIKLEELNAACVAAQGRCAELKATALRDVERIRKDCQTDLETAVKQRQDAVAARAEALEGRDKVLQKTREDATQILATARHEAEIIKQAAAAAVAESQGKLDQIRSVIKHATNL